MSIDYVFTAAVKKEESRQFFLLKLKIKQLFFSFCWEGKARVAPSSMKHQVRKCTPCISMETGCLILSGCKNPHQWG